MQVMAWVLGEYGGLASSPRGPHEVSTKLCAVASGLSFRDPSTCGFVVTALMKLSAQSGYENRKRRWVIAGVGAPVADRQTGMA